MQEDSSTCTLEEWTKSIVERVEKHKTKRARASFAQDEAEMQQPSQKTQRVAALLQKMMLERNLDAVTPELMEEIRGNLKKRRLAAMDEAADQQAAMDEADQQAATDEADQQAATDEADQQAATDEADQQAATDEAEGADQRVQQAEAQAKLDEAEVRCADLRVQQAEAQAKLDEAVQQAADPRG